MNWLGLASGLYKLVLKLYPASFRGLFENDMQATFADLLADTQTSEQVMWSVACEIAGLLMGAAREHGAEIRQSSPQAQARRIIQAGSLFMLLFLIVATLDSEHVSRFSFILFNLILAVGLLCAWRWGQRGGLVFIACALTVCFLMLTYFNSLETMSWLALIPSVLYTLPFVLFGVMFTVLGSPKRQLA